MREILERRFKLIRITNEVQPTRYEMTALLRKLPEDARIVRTFDDYTKNCYGFIVWSSEWEVTPLGCEISELSIEINIGEVADVKTEMTTPPSVHPSQMHPYSLPRVAVDAHKAKLEEVKKFIANSTGVTPEQLGCKCDLAYTGAKTHSKGCPLKA